MAAAWMMHSPTPPTPITATASFGRTLAELSAAPQPVITAQPMIAVTSVATSASINPLTLRLLQAPIVPLIFKLAWPNMMIMLAQAGAALVDTWWLAKLGNDALAGMVLVFPFIMLVGTISGGSIGAGISAAVARALRHHHDAAPVLLGNALQ